MADGTPQSKDSHTNLPLIEGKGSPISGAVFRRTGRSGIIVDLDSFKSQPWFKTTVELVNAEVPGWKTYVVESAKLMMPLNPESEKVIQESAMTIDSYRLSTFSKNDKGNPKATRDAQTLYVAMLTELHVKDKKGGREVAVIKDQADGHAVMLYKSERGDYYKFDPSVSDKFVKQTPK